MIGEATMTQTERRLHVGRVYRLGNKEPIVRVKFKGQLGPKLFFMEWNQEGEYVSYHRVVNPDPEKVFNNLGNIEIESLNPLQVGETRHLKSVDARVYDILVKVWEGIKEER